MHLICSLTAWGCQGAHNGLCDSLGWQGEDFTLSASFLILNEIMLPGPESFSPIPTPLLSQVQPLCPFAVPNPWGASELNLATVSLEAVQRAPFLKAVVSTNMMVCFQLLCRSDWINVCFFTSKLKLKNLQKFDEYIKGSQLKVFGYKP